MKRSKNWTEEETIAFIRVWSENYVKLTSGGSRNTPVYNAMAKQLNEMLPNRILNGADVKSKIGNLLTEYRKKKKARGNTGGSPSPWRYFELIDKIIGESCLFIV